jgi:hypothetical protein
MVLWVFNRGKGSKLDIYLLTIYPLLLHTNTLLLTNNYPLPYFFALPCLYL